MGEPIQPITIPKNVELMAPIQNEIWLTVAKSNIAHRFYDGGGINPHYRYSACGFETVQPKLREYDGGRRCKRCERAGEF